MVSNYNAAPESSCVQLLPEEWIAGSPVSSGEIKWETISTATAASMMSLVVFVMPDVQKPKACFMK